MRPLTHNDKVAAFKVATAVFVRDYGDTFAAGMTDEELGDALVRSLGVFCGKGGPGQLHLTWQGAGLKIWASWHVHNHVKEAPVFSGHRTIAMAREVYGIPDPSRRQLTLF